MATTTGPKETPSLHMFENKNKHFYGRDDKIQELFEAIEERKDEADSFCRTIVLTGFDGMGKSETVRAFVEKFQETFDCIVWIDAQTQQSLEGSFKKLAKKLDTSFNYLNYMQKIPKKLSKRYKKGLFIFENAERLDTVDDQLGIEDFLYMDVLKTKFIFLVTSPNGRENWAGLQSKLKFISIDSLTKKDAIKMLKNYLLIQENSKIPASLENTISLLVDTSGGYPLGLSFIGSIVVGKTEGLSLEEIESGLKAYTEVLKVSLKDISGAKKYEVALEVIYKETMRRIKTMVRGEVGVELLNIMACLNSSKLNIGLVNAIYSGTTCESKEENEAKNSNVTTGLNLLIDNSLIEKEGPRSWKMQKLAQQCGRKAQIFQEAMNKICSFFELNEVNRHWTGHIRTLADTLASGSSIDNKNYKLCLLVWRCHFETGENLEQILQKGEFCFNLGLSHESIMFQLLEICYSITVDSVLPSINWEDIEMRILGLSENFACQVWVMRAILEFLDTCLESEKPPPPSTRERINSFIINQCMDIPTEKLEIFFSYGCPLLEIIYGHNSSRNILEDSLFVKKLFQSPREGFRNVLWRCVSNLQTNNDKNDNLVCKLFAICGMGLFTPSLKFTSAEEKKEFASNDGFRYLLDVLRDVLVSREEPKIILEFEEFSKPFLGVFKSWLDSNKDICDFIEITIDLITLFVVDTDTYYIFHEEDIEKNFEIEIMKKLIWNRSSFELASDKEDFLHQIRTLAKAMILRQWNAKWVYALLVYAESTEWDNDNEEEKKNRYSNEIFEILGVELFIATLNFKNDEDRETWCEYTFKNYLDHLLRIWKTPGNLKTFLKSSDFINAFMDIARIRLETIEIHCVFDVSLHFCLCFAVLWLFDSDKNIYDDFNISLDPLFENALKQVVLTIKSQNWDVLEMLTYDETDGHLKDFELKVQNCQWKPTWATEFLEIINIPLEALKSL